MTVVKRANQSINDFPLEVVDFEEDIDSYSSSSSGPKKPEMDIGTDLPYSVDYSDSNLLKYVKKGDIIHDPIGAQILWVNSGHSAIVEGIFHDPTYNQDYIRLIESNPEPGVARGLLSPSRYTDSQMTVLRVSGATQEQIDDAVDFAVSQLDKNYSLTPFNKGSSSTKTGWYCSELVWASYYNQGIGLDPSNNSNNGDFVWPSEIYESSLTKKIASYNKTTTSISLNSDTHEIQCDGDTFIENHSLYRLSTSKKCSVCDEEFPIQYAERQVPSTSYQFPQQYNNTYPILKPITMNDFSFNTSRLRCGYINDTGITGLGDWHITLSPRKLGAGEAYLAYDFFGSIGGIEIDLSFWSASEQLNSSNGTATIDYKTSNGDWITSLNLLTEVNLSTNRTQPNTYYVDFPESATQFRVRATSNNPIGSANTGRIVIGNLVVYQEI